MEKFIKFPKFKFSKIFQKVSKILERSGFRVYVRKVVSTVRELPQEEDVENTLESCKINLEKQQKQIETLNQEIAELVGADVIEKEILDLSEFKASLQETIPLISSRLSFAKESKNSPETTPSINQQEAPIGAKTSSKAKRPKFTLPTFAGDPTEWITFWDRFASAIHLSEEPSEIDKFQYLKSLLVGTAAKTISGLPLSGSNYNHAVDLLTKRFASMQLIIRKHIEMLMQLPKLNNSSDLKQLRKLLDKTEAATRSLQGIGVSSVTYGTFLTPVKSYVLF